MRLFSDFDVYERKYTYDEMKVMSLFDKYERKHSKDEFVKKCLMPQYITHDDMFLDYEDICRIVEAVYAHWANDDERYQEKIDQYPWIEIDGEEEYGYIQAYASRVLPEFIRLYKEMFIL